MTDKVIDIRSKLMGQPVKFKEIEHEYDGSKIIFRQPSQRVRSAIFEKSLKDNGNLDTTAFQVWTVIYLTYDESGKRVFSDADFDALADLPTGSYVEEFAAKAVVLIGGELSGN